MTRMYGRSAKGKRCVDHIPHGHWHTNTFIAGLRCNAITAPILYDGTMNSITFLGYISEVLAPTLNKGDIVICDNLSSHKTQGVKEAIEQCGASIKYLPAYSPDLNPIELAFSKMKAIIKAFTIENFTDILNAAKQALLSFSAQTCANLFRHANYGAMLF